MEAAMTDPADMVMDPAEQSAIAHSTAELLLARGQTAEEAEVRETLVKFADEHGLDTLAELWSGAHPISLPGALWRLYLLRAALQNTPDDAALVFQRGVETLNTIDQVVAGAPDSLSGDSFISVLDDILLGAFEGDFSFALDRASAVAKAVSAGAIALAWDREDEARYLTSRSLTWSLIAQELETAAAACRAGKLS